MNIDIFEEALKRKPGFNGLVGIQIEDIGVGTSVCTLDVKDHHKNPAGTIHGGVLCTILDTAAGLSGMYKGNCVRALVTQSGDIHFLRGVREGKITAKGTLIKDGRNVAVARADVFSDNQELIATGTFELFYTDSGVSIEKITEENCNE